MKKKVLIILLIIIEIWSVTGLVYTAVNKNKDQEEINNKEEIKDNINETEENDNSDEEQDDEAPDVENKGEDNKNEEDKVTDVKPENPPVNNNQDSNNNSGNSDKPVINNDKTNTETTVDPVTVINTEDKEETETITKYGVKITSIKTYTVTTYSDGKEEKKLKNSKDSCDKSNYNGTVEDMKIEANGLVAKNSAISNEILNYVNNYRTEVSAQNLVLDEKLSLAATIRAMEMAYTSSVTNISHTRPNGNKFWTIMDDLKLSYNVIGENIAADSGFGTAKSTSEGWRKSQGHYENMINTKHNKMGVGYVELCGSKYWVQIFTN